MSVYLVGSHSTHNDLVAPEAPQSSALGRPALKDER
jgi:hypothetical protein